MPAVRWEQQWRRGRRAKNRATVQGPIRARFEPFGRRLERDRLQLEVADDGPGTPPETVSRIFDPFHTTKPPGVGTGLGLSTMYGMVQEQGGEATADNRQGRGATSSLELPAINGTGVQVASKEHALAARSRVDSAQPAAGRDASKKHILIVEDEPTVAELISEVMADEGHRVEILLDSRAALGRLEHNKYSLVICDLKMPYVDGSSLYRTLVRKANPMQRKLLFVTGDTTGARTLEFLKSCGLPYLAKPFLVDELKEAVRKALAGVQNMQAHSSSKGQIRAAEKNR